METFIVDQSNRRVEVLPDLEALSRRAAAIFVAASGDSIAAKKRFTVALSGGSTPRRLYTLLGSEGYRNRVGWEHVHFFWADERCVPREDEASNFKAGFDALLSRVAPPEQNVHRIKGEEAPDRAARDYEEEIRRFFGPGWPVFDLIILGVVEDGHTASLFPGSKSIDETARLAIPVYLEKPGKNRVTLTLPVLNNADQILFLVAGPSKAAVLSGIFGEKEKKKRLPVELINPARGNMVWLIDREAAGKPGGLQF